MRWNDRDGRVPAGNGWSGLQDQNREADQFLTDGGVK